MTPIPDDNPYAAPESAVADLAAETVPRRWRWPAWWTLVFGANLITPLLFASDMVGGYARLGMAGAVGACWAAVLLAGERSARVRSVALTGGTLVAVSQVFPVLHIMAGIFGVGLVGGMGDDDHAPRLETPTSAFLATLLTGGCLMLAAGVSGWVGQWLLNRFRKSGPPPEL